MNKNKTLEERLEEEGQKNIRLEKVMKALLESDSTVEALRKIVRPFADADEKIDNKPACEWYEEVIFNEQRLYNDLGKDDARSVLGIWRRFREACELLKEANNAVQR